MTKKFIQSSLRLSNAWLASQCLLIKFNNVPIQSQARVIKHKRNKLHSERDPCKSESSYLESSLGNSKVWMSSLPDHGLKAWHALTPKRTKLWPDGKKMSARTLKTMRHHRRSYQARNVSRDCYFNLRSNVSTSPFATSGDFLKIESIDAVEQSKVICKFMEYEIKN